MSARSPIPKEIREQLENDVFMSTCVAESWKCSGRIEWHHAFTYMGKRINALWSILPLCKQHHKETTKETQVLCRMALRARIRHFGARKEFNEKYSKSDLYKQLKEKITERLKTL